MKDAVKMLVPLAIILPILVLLIGASFTKNLNRTPQPPAPAQNSDPLLPIFIDSLRNRSYSASEIVIEETLAPGANYDRYIASYMSDGLKIYGLFTIPRSTPTPLPAIVFLHGYLDPKTYNTTERYVAYQDGFAREGFITFKPDLRGHGKSEGDAVTSNFSEKYVVDTLNLVSALKADKRIDETKIGVWGHSMGGGIGLRAMVVSKDLKAGNFWAGVVGDYNDILERYSRRADWLERQSRSAVAREFFEKYGSPSANPKFWNRIDPYAHLSDISGPIQLHHGTADESVPLEFSQHLKNALEEKGKPVEIFEYPDSDHNIAQSFSLAMTRSVEFFKEHLVIE